MGLMPRRLADWVDGSARLKSWLGPRLDRGRRVRSQSLRGHLQLRFLAGLRRWRRGNRRHAEEQAHLVAWLQAVHETLPHDYALAVEMLRCRRVVKGYSDTHARGTGRFDQLMSAAARLRGQAQAARSLATLREAALSDSEGRKLGEQLMALGLS